MLKSIHLEIQTCKKLLNKNVEIIQDYKKEFEAKRFTV